MDKFSKAEIFLIQTDDLLSPFIKSNGPITPRPQKTYFEALTSSIISQQISVKAAAKIFGRFREITDLTPSKVLSLTEAEIKEIGLSGQKSRYINDLAFHFHSDPAVFNHLEELPDEEVISELTKVKGIGVWTAQMFLLFTLRRPDIFAPDDRGLQLAIQNIYSLPTLPPRKELESFASRWQPYRSTASLHLWKSLDNTPK